MINALSQSNAFLNVDINAWNGCPVVTVQREDDTATRESFSAIWSEGVYRMDELKARLNAEAGAEVTYEVWNVPNATFQATLVGFTSTAAWFRRDGKDFRIPFVAPDGQSGYLKSLTVALS